MAREVIAAEMTGNLIGAINRVRTVDCAERRLGALGEMLDASSKGGSLPPLGDIGMPYRQIYSKGGWDSVVASQTATHFPDQELANLFRSYNSVQRLADGTNEETDAWISLYTMVGPGRRLDAASEAKLRDALSRARTLNRRLAGNSVQLIRAIKDMHLRFTQESLVRIGRAELRMPMGPHDQSVSACGPIGAVPASYGEGAASTTKATEIDEIAKHPPDFGTPAP